MRNFFFKYLKKSEKIDFLNSIIIYLRVGLSFKNTILEISTTEDNKNISDNALLIYDEIDDGILNEVEILEKYKIIEPFEKEIIEKIKGIGLKESLQTILNDKEKKYKINRNILFLFLPIFSSLLSVSTFLYFFQNIIKKALLNVSETFVVNNINIPWFLEVNNSYFLYFSILLVIIFISSISIFLYLDYYNKPLLFKYFKIKSFEETPKILKILQNIKLNPEINLNTAFSLMNNFENLKSYKNLFKELQENELENESLSKIFKKYYFPNVAVSIIKRAKNKLDFFEDFHFIYEDCEKKLNNNLTKINTIYRKMSLYIAFFIPIYIIASLYISLFLILIELLDKNI